MKFTIGRKLGVGFGAILVLMVVSTMLAYSRVRDMRDDAEHLTQSAFPALHACEDLRSSLNESLAALRGLLLLVDDPDQRAASSNDRQKAWERIHQSLEKLSTLNAINEGEVQTATLDALRRDVASLAAMHDRIEALAIESERNVSHALVSQEWLPMREALRTGLEKMAEATDVSLSGAADSTVSRSIGDALIALAEADASLRLYAAGSWTTTSTELTADDVRSAWQTAEQKLQRIDELEPRLSSEQRQAWTALAQVRDQFDTVPAKVIEVRSSAGWRQVSDLLENEAVPLAGQIQDTCDQMVAKLSEDVQQRRSKLAAASSVLTQTLLASSAIAILMSCAVAFFVSRQIVMPIRALADRATRIGQGDLRAERVNVRSDDEIRVLADAFNEMLDSLRDLTSQIGQVTLNINSSSAEILAAARQQAASTREQAASVQQMSSTMQELTRSGEQVRERASEVIALTEASGQMSNDGIRAVSQTAETMETIREQVEQVAQNIVSLAEQTQTIGEIISSVNDMSEQSNLLALNASIESVSAGESGSRFGVVAGEMKNLADQAKQSTVQVRTILSDIQKGINGSVMLAEEAVKRVMAGRERSDQTEVAIREMSRASDESIRAFQQITGAANQQLAGFEQVAQGVSNIRTASEQTASSIAQLERSATDLNALSTQLRACVERYKL